MIRNIQFDIYLGKSYDRRGKETKTEGVSCKTYTTCLLCIDN